MLFEPKASLHRWPHGKASRREIWRSQIDEVGHDSLVTFLSCNKKVTRPPAGARRAEPPVEVGRVPAGLKKSPHVEASRKVAKGVRGEWGFRANDDSPLRGGKISNAIALQRGNCEKRTRQLRVVCPPCYFRERTEAVSASTVGSSLLLVVFALFLVFLNGFFVAAEFGLVKLRQTRVQAIARHHGWRGRILLKVHRNLDAYLSACQLGITLASLGLGWVGEPAFAGLLRPLLLLVGIETEQAIHAIAFFFAFFIISYLHIVIGELAPKSMAIRLTERVGLWTAAPLYAFYWAMYPAIWILNHSSNWVLQKVGLDTAHGHEAHYSTEELKLILRSSRANTDFIGDEWRVLAKALDFRDLEVADLMRPFNEAIALSGEEDLEHNLDRMLQHRFSRYLYLDKNGQVQGVIHLKDVFFAQRKGQLAEGGLSALVRPVLTVTPTLSASELFRRFREGAPHFAVVAQRPDHPLGFLTLDNLLGALVGEIRDEFRQTGNDWMKMDDGSLLGKGSLPIFSLERALGIDIEETGVDSVGGMILQRLGSIPEEGQKIAFGHFDAVVKKMKGPRILLIRIYPHQGEPSI